MSQYYKAIDNSFLLFVKVIPNSKQTGIFGLIGNRLKIKVSLPAEQGKANKAVIDLLAKELSISKKNIEIKFGASSPEKNLLIQNITEEQIRGLVD